MQYWFTADEHYAHWNINKFCNRGFKDLHTMHKALRDNFNSVVGKRDITCHLGDFSLETDYNQVYTKYIQPLNGLHYFLKGSHDTWLKREEKSNPPYQYPYLIEQSFNEHYIVLCHYCMTTWPRSHWGSIQLFGHSHGRLIKDEVGAHQMDVGVDTNNFFPYSLDEIVKELKGV